MMHGSLANELPQLLELVQLVPHMGLLRCSVTTIRETILCGVPDPCNCSKVYIGETFRSKNTKIPG